MAVTSSDHILQHIFSLTNRGIKFGLDKTYEGARRLGNPQSTYPCFHVAGTNGKGSTCAFLDAMLRAQGLKTGLFTSPHIVRFEERFCINGRPISHNQWLTVYNDVKQIIDDLRLTFFEASALLAFEIFKLEKVDWAIFEVGMGGRLDATNIVTPRVSVIASIGMDHREFLGDDLVAIAGEKLGIVKPRVPLVMQRPMQEEIRTVAEARCRELGSPLTWVEAGNCIAGEAATSLTYKGLEFETRLLGAHQALNALTAITAMETAGFTDLPTLAQGIREASIPGRFHFTQVKGRTIVFDVAHNPQAAQVLAAALTARFGESGVCVVAGIMRDKDSAGVITALAPAASRFIFTRPLTDRAEDPAVLPSRIPAAWTGATSIVTGVADAVQAAIDSQEAIICVTGSFYTVGEAMQALGVEPFEEEER